MLEGPSIVIFFSLIVYPIVIFYSLIVYPKENCALFALLAFSQTTQVSSVMSCFSLDETNLTNYLARPDNYNIHSHQSESVLIFFLSYLT